MSAVRNVLISVIVALLTSFAADAQVRCAFDEIQNQKLKKNPKQTQEFESWMKKKIEAAKGQRTNASFQIPVVVHILHNGEPVGVGLNIPNAQVISQIKVLNDDYRRMNADASNTPAEFAGVASSIDIEFILAKQDPDGLPTNGIVRKKANETTAYNPVSDSVKIKTQSYWPSEDYLNIWVTNLSGSYLGASTFPETGLSGVQGPFGPRIDGVVIHYKAFGSSADGSFDLLSAFSKGRTTTHEVGHFFSLLHTFGDGAGCSSTDFVTDTPSQSQETSGCPSTAISSCGHHTMFQNYLDYTDDACMNMFTAGQIARVNTVLQNSPRRLSLLTSHGLIAPTISNLDLEARSILSPSAVTCGDDIVPKVVVRNRGTTAITSAKINLTINGNSIQTKDFTGNLAQFGEATITFNTIDLAEPSSNNVLYTITQINGAANDDVAGNNSMSLTSNVSVRSSLPLLEPFNTIPSNWQIDNPDQLLTWTVRTAPKSGSGNKAMFVDLYDYENVGAIDQLRSPFFAIPTGNDAVLRFDHAYARFQGINTERLRVLVSVGCSADLSLATEVFNKAGSVLATANDTNNPFVPSGESQWTSNLISLGAFGDKNVRLIFEVTNAQGNNVYLDNVELSSGDFNDVAITEIISPQPVICNSKPAPVVTVQNLGTSIITRLSVTTQVNGSVGGIQAFNSLNISPGESTTLTLSPVNLQTGSNALSISVANPLVTIDDQPANNSVSFTRIVNTAADVIPTRQNFDSNIDTWTIFSEGASKKWEGAMVNTYGNALVYRAFQDPVLTNESWVVSPVIDFSRWTEGSLLFDTSYGKRATGDDRLKVMVSEDCGQTYNSIPFEQTADDLSSANVATEWTPADADDWKTQYVSLNEYAGKKNLRFAFVFDNENGNDLYLDNIEFFVTDSFDHPKISSFYCIYNSETNPFEFFVTFNFPVRQSARLLVYNTIGQVVIDNQLPDALNQTYTVNLYGQQPGVYIARFEAGAQSGIAKLFVGR